VREAFDMSGKIYAVKIFHSKGEDWQAYAKQHMEIVSPLDHVRRSNNAKRYVALY